MSYKKIIYQKQANFDKQGNYFWTLVCKAAWTRDRVTMLLLDKYKKTHWNILDKNEKKQVIAIMKNYAKKAEDNREKKLRQNIYAIWIKNGFNKEELQSLMIEWGYGNSLRLCEMKSLQEIRKNVIKITNPKLKGEKNNG